MNKKSSDLLIMGTLTILADGGVVLTKLPDSFTLQRVYAVTSNDITVYSKVFLTLFNIIVSSAYFQFGMCNFKKV